MDPITIAMGLAQFVPQIAKWLTGSDQVEQVAQKVVNIAQAVTGQPTGDAALKAMQADPALVLQYRQAVLAQELEFQRMAVKNASDINATMRAEVTAEHWPSYSWRPAIGFSFAAYITAQWSLPLFHIASPHIDAQLMLAIGSILGVASWFRGKMQADPAVPTVNRG
jgi:hypothetical protein